jgi:hypothetical protein
VEGPVSAARAAEQVVILSSIDWDMSWQRHHIFAAALAAAGRQVFFIENTGIRNPSWSDLPRLKRRVQNIFSPRAASGGNPVPKGLTIIPPRVLPPGLRIFRALNARQLIPALRRQLAAAGLRPGAACVAYVATPTTVELAKTLSPSVVVYDCASNFRAHPRTPPDFPANERALLELSDQVICDSDFLFEQKKAEHRFVEKIHQGVPEDFFHVPAPPAGGDEGFCYYGTWSGGLDSRYVEALAAAGLRTTVSGFTKGDAPPLSPAVRRLAPVPLAQVAASLAPYRGFILPYRLYEYAKGVMPAKIYECLATGRPVLATPLPALKALEGLIYVAETPDDWVRIARELPRTETEELRRARIAHAREHSVETESRRFIACLDAARRRREAAAR